MDGHDNFTNDIYFAWAGFVPSSHGFNSKLLATVMNDRLIHNSHRSRSRGFTLLEMLVTMAVLAILSTIAVPSFTTFIVNSQLRSVVSTLQSDTMNARAEAIKLAKPVLVRPTVAGTGWISGWQTVVLNTDGTDFQTILTRDSVSSYLALGNNTVGSSIRYDSAGFSRDTAGVFIAGCIRFDATYSSRTSAMYVDAAGRPRTCTAPSVGNVTCCA